MTIPPDRQTDGTRDRLQRSRACHLGRVRACAPLANPTVRLELGWSVWWEDTKQSAYSRLAQVSLNGNSGQNASRRVSQSEVPPATNSPPNSLEFGQSRLIANTSGCPPRDSQDVQARLQQDRPETAPCRPSQTAIRRPRLQRAAIPPQTQLLRDAAHSRHHPRAIRAMGNRPSQRYRHTNYLGLFGPSANAMISAQSSPSSRHAPFATNPPMRPPPT